MEILNELEIQQLELELIEILGFQVREDNSFGNPSFGEIWICQLPILKEINGEIQFATVHRPVLVIDDTTEHFVKKDTRNYYVLKLTSQKDSYRREEIPDYQLYGLQKKSYIRIEIPLKVEKCQFCYKISSLPIDITNNYLNKIQIYLKK